MPPGAWTSRHPNLWQNGQALPDAARELRGVLWLTDPVSGADTLHVCIDDGTGTFVWQDLDTRWLLVNPNFTVDPTTGRITKLDGETITIGAGTGSPEGVITAAVGSLWLRTDGGAGTIIYEKASGAGNTGWLANTSGVQVTVQEEDVTKVTNATTFDFDGSDFNATDEGSGEVRIALAYGTGAGTPAEGNHTHDPFIPITYLAFNDTGVSTTSTVTYSTVVTRTFTLPAGTWTVEAMFWGRIGHDADGTVNLRTVIDGTNGTAVTRSAPSSGAYPGGAGSSKSSVASGSRTVSGQVKASSAGEATMTNACMVISCARTA